MENNTKNIDVIKVMSMCGWLRLGTKTIHNATNKGDYYNVFIHRSVKDLLIFTVANESGEVKELKAQGVSVVTENGVTSYTGTLFSVNTLKELISELVERKVTSSQLPLDVQYTEYEIYNILKDLEID